MSSSDPDPDPLAAELRIATFRLARRLRRERAVDSMSDAQMAVLGILRLHGRQTLGSLADHERVTAPTMTRTVAWLEEQGYIVRTPDDDDRRRIHIDITPEGERVVSETTRKRDESLLRALHDLHLDDDDRELLRRASVLMRRIAER